MIVQLGVVLLLFLTTVKAGNCPGGFVEHGEKCYKVSSDRLSWHEARFECLSLDGNYDLAIIDNPDLFEFLKAYNNHWIGLYSRVGKRDFKWVDGKNVEFGRTYKQKPWAATEPSDLGAHEDCVHTMPGGLWNDYYCGARYNYICGPASQQWCEFISEYECNDEYVKIHCPKTCSRNGLVQKIRLGTQCSAKGLNEIESADECKAAATELGLKWASSWSGQGDFPACLHAEDGRNMVYFNTHKNPGRTHLNQKYAAICKGKAKQIITAPGSKACIIENGVYIAAGNDVKVMKVGRGHNECASNCASTKGCVAWTFKISTSYCWLKSDESSKGKAEDWMTGTKSCGLECWKQRNGDYVKEGHGKENECYATIEEAKAKCLAAGDCRAIATQNNVCGGKFRVTHGGPTFIAFGNWQPYAIIAYEYICDRGFECKEGWQEFGNSCYKMIKETKTWNEAESECEKSGAHLTSINSAEEHAFVTKLHDPTRVHITWIGGIRDGNSFKWKDGSAFTYQNWNSGEPNDHGGIEDCMELYSAPGQKQHDKWNDVSCDVNKRADGFVCKKSK